MYLFHTSNSASVSDRIIPKQSVLYLFTVLPAKSDSDVMFYLQSYQGLILDRRLIFSSQRQRR